MNDATFEIVRREMERSSLTELRLAEIQECVSRGEMPDGATLLSLLATLRAHRMLASWLSSIETMRPYLRDFDERLRDVAEHARTLIGEGRPSPCG